MSRIKVLLADDHEKLRDTMCYLLNHDGRFEVVGACGDSDMAISEAVEKRPDIVLMDINISPLNGFQATAILCRISSRIKVIAFTLHSEVIFVRQMFSIGAKGYVAKTSALAEILESIVIVHAGSQFVSSEIRERFFGREFPDGVPLSSGDWVCSKERRRFYII